MSRCVVLVAIMFSFLHTTAQDSASSISSYSSVTIEDSLVQELKSDPDYWYADYKPAEKTAEQRDNIFISQWARTAFWLVIIIAFVAILAYYVTSGRFLLVRKGARKLRRNEEPLAEENLLITDFSPKIRSAIEKQDFREAIRYLFLQTLSHLHHAGLIAYSTERTNEYYLLQLKGSSYEAGFQDLLRTFEFTWYGQFDLSPLHFQMANQQFAKFQSDIAS